MQNILIIANAAPYGSELLFNALRLATTLKEQKANVHIFLLSDAVTAGIKGQKPRESYDIQKMLEYLCAQEVPVLLCKTCTDARGIENSMLISGLSIATLAELADWTLAADKVLTF